MATARFTPVIVINLLTAASSMRPARSRGRAGQVFRQPVRLTNVRIDRRELIVRQLLSGPAAPGRGR
ncbi:hypothetical protein BCCGELA001_30840 [Bradyrhizobium sp. CCGE-LA001]|nr:hypothetical protein BCCGELA001_30840 [Bradyrhizobium sp. CCGE-LA001]